MNGSTPGAAVTTSPNQLFLTGATGSVGSAVLPHLLARGFGVTALVRKPVRIDGCRAVVGSLEDLAKVADEVAVCTGILHLACTRSSAAPAVLGQDVAGTGALIDLWRRGPFVFVSASTIYGYPRGALTEATQVVIESGFDAGKVSNELQLRLAERRGERGGAALLRPAMILSSAGRQGRQVLGGIYRQCQLGGRFLFDSERGLDSYGCAFVGANDFGRILVEALTRGLSGPYNIAGGFCTWRELIETINRLAGTKGDCVIRPDTRPQAGEVRLPQSRTELDTTAFQQATGFQPRQTLEEIVEAFVRMERDQQPV